jgi:uncharacterized protein YyaL (SSP411 family)
MDTAARPVPWDGWSPAVFARASSENRPILLYLFAIWSAACDDLERRTLSAEPVASVLADAFVPVKVDADRRPDVSARYGLGAPPSLLVLTPEGDVLTGGQTPGDATALAAQLMRVRDAFRSGQPWSRARDLALAGSWATPVGPGRPIPPPDHLADAFLSALPDLRSTEADLVWIEHAPALRALLILARRRHADNTVRVQAEAWLERLAERSVDPSSGAVWRSAGAGRDGVVLLETQAALFETLVEAVATLDSAGPRALMAGVGAFLRRRLRHPSGGFVHALRWPDAAEPARLAANVDLRRFVDANASAARALLRGAQVAGDAVLAEEGVLVLERVAVPAFARGEGLSHVLEPEPVVRGLLADQVATAWACLDAFDASGMRVYLDFAEELMRVVLQTHWDPDAGAFRDRAGPLVTGAADLPLYPLATNGLASRVLAGLARRTEAPDLAGRARDVVGAIAPLLDTAGPDGAAVVLAAFDLLSV